MPEPHRPGPSQHVVVPVLTGAVLTVGGGGFVALLVKRPLHGYGSAFKEASMWVCLVLAGLAVGATVFYFVIPYIRRETASELRAWQDDPGNMLVGVWWRVANDALDGRMVAFTPM